jgi:hypothetical protein
MFKILYSLALMAGCSLLSSLNHPPVDAYSFFIDENGNFLGARKSDEQSVHVIGKNQWITLQKANENVDAHTLERFSTSIDQYQEGLPSDAMAATWKKIKAAGGKGYKAFVKNNSPHYIYFKPEKYITGGVNALPLKPATELYAPVDGVNVPVSASSRDLSGKVFRVPDNVQITVADNGVPAVTGITDYAFTFFLDIVFMNKYMKTKIPDEGWLDLRDVFNQGRLSTERSTLVI